uniref:Uncharacterized protein n=1 Tax=Tanacetum cinerariifolium TaxID=118510 RepID=A0A6L2L376_TANCI|nr:hypothetical protein [Tanacetum cinerariifolium]
MTRKKVVGTKDGKTSQVQRCLFRNIFTSAPVCDDCLQQECYRSLSTNAVLASRVECQGTSQNFVCRNQSSSEKRYRHDIRRRAVIEYAHKETACSYFPAASPFFFFASCGSCESSDLFAGIDFVSVVGGSLEEVHVPEKNKSIMEDCRLPRETKRFCGEKMVDFLSETQSKDTERMLQLQSLGREAELRAHEKELFIEKLKDVVFDVNLPTITLTSAGIFDVRAFATIINKCLSGKETGMDKIENKDAKKTNKMSYPRFTKIIIDYFMSKDQFISRRNKMSWHTSRDDTMFTSMRCISKHEKTQVYGAILLKDLTNQTMLESKAYKTYYAFASGEKTPKPNKKDFHISHESGSCDVVGTQSNVPDEQQQKTFGTDEGTSTKLRVPNVPKYESESNKESWRDSDEEDDDEDEYEDDVNDSDDIRNEDTKMINAYQGAPEQQNASQQSGFEQEEEDAHVTLTPILDTQKTGGPTQSSSVYSDITRKLLNLDNPSPADNEIASLMDTTTHHEISIPKITSKTTTSLLALPDFASAFKFNESVSNLEKDLSKMKQVDKYAKALSSIPAIVDRYIDNKLGEAINKAIQAPNFGCREEAQAEKRKYIELVDSTVRTIIKKEVNTQLPQILPQGILDVATLVIEKNITEFLEAVVLTRAFSTIINKCLSGKETGMDKIENKDAKKTNKMSYPRFTKIIIDYFMSKDQFISRRNKMSWHTSRDDTMFTSMRCISKHEKTQVYGAILLKDLTNQTMLESKAYKTYYAFASGEKTPKPKSKKDFHISHESGSCDVVGTQSNVPDEQQQKTFGTDEGTSTKLRVPNVPKYESESNKESWRDSDEEDDDEDEYEDDVNDSDDISNEGGDDNDGNNDNDGDDDANDDDKQESDDKNDDDEETDGYRTESDKIKIRNEDTKMINAYQGAPEQQNASQQSGFEQEEEDAHVTLTPILDTQKTGGPTQSSSVYSDITRKLLNLNNPSPADNEIASLMDTTTHHEIAIPKITSSFTTPTPPPPLFFNPLSQQATPTPKLTASETTTSLLALPDFASAFKFNESVSNLEKDLSKMKQVDKYAKALSSIPAIVDRYIDNKLGEAINKAIQAPNFGCREEAQAEKRKYIELVDSTVRTIIKKEVNTQLPQILPQGILDVATLVIEKNITEFLEAVVLTRSSSQQHSSYEAATTLSEFELTKILIDKMEKNKSFNIADYKRELYDALVKSYNTNKDIFKSYGKVFSLTRSQDNKDKD